MNNYKQHLTCLGVLMTLLLTLLPFRSVYASFVDELTPLPVQAGWNPSIWIFRQMHASPDGRYFSYLEYAGDPAELGSPEFSEEKDLTYRHVVFDSSNGTAYHSPEITLHTSVQAIAEYLISGSLNNSGELIYYTAPVASQTAGIYRFSSALALNERILNDYAAVLSVSANGRYALVLRSKPENYAAAQAVIYDLQQSQELDMSFASAYSLDISSSFNISDNATLVMRIDDETFSEAIIDPINQTIVSLTDVLGLGDVGAGILLTPDGTHFITRDWDEKTVVYGSLADNNFVTYTMAQLGIDPIDDGYPLDISNPAYGMAASTGVAGNAVISYAVSDNTTQSTWYREFDLATGQLLQENIISPVNGYGYIPVVTRGAGTGTFFIGAEVAEDSMPTSWKYYYHSAGEQQRTLRIEASILSVDTYYSPQFSVDIKTLGEHYAVDASCTLNGPAALASASYGNWGSANRLQLPLQWQGQSLSGALSQTAPDAAVDGEQMLFNTVVLAEMTTDTLTVNCSGEMSDANGHLLSVMPDTITITLDDGIHGGNSAVNGQIVLPGGVTAEDVVVNITIDGRTISVTPDENGNFSFSGLRAGDFTVDFQSEGYVQSCMNATLDGAGNHDFGQIELLAGDINQDGAIDIADFTFLSGRYGTQQGEENYVATADLNKDTVINVQDLAILASHFGSQQCNP